MYFAQGQNVQFKIQLFELLALPTKARNELMVTLELNQRYFNNSGRVWHLRPPFNATKVLIHNASVKPFSHLEVKADHLYRVRISDPASIVQVRSKDKPASILHPSSYVERRVRDRLAALGFKCVPMGGPGRPDLIATHVATGRTETDVEVNHSPDRYSTDKFALDVEKFRKFSQQRSFLQRLLVVYSGAYIEKGVFAHPHLKSSSITLIGFRSLCELVEAVRRGHLTREKALLHLVKAGEVRFRQPTPRVFDPIPNPRIVRIIHNFGKKPYPPMPKRGRRRSSLLPSLVGLDTDVALHVLRTSVAKTAEFHGPAGLAAICSTQLETNGSRQRRVTAWVKTLQEFGLLDGKARITPDGEQVLLLWDSKSRKLAEQRLAFHFLSSPGVSEVLEIVRQENGAPRRHGNRSKFLHAVGEKASAAGWARTAGQAAREIGEVLRLADDFHLSLGWDRRVKIYRIDSATVERIRLHGGHGAVE